ncbi:related to archipelago beta form (F-box-WD40 repeat protein) [Serendipita indica DSM 11827]|uniref:Related to archipelago beta form (F-box-WD40 repeat protein) n=1 Tax=Serendipita indica (strain DSM 11827) TaxID=1109443 RepID=G4TYS9_SERID|nr:related to archipelago beta form (F-box-WD40 repeat protein) [Serendipita indica DSM 11827]
MGDRCISEITSISSPASSFGSSFSAFILDDLDDIIETTNVRGSAEEPQEVQVRIDTLFENLASLRSSAATAVSSSRALFQEFKYADWIDIREDNITAGPSKRHDKVIVQDDTMATSVESHKEVVEAQVPKIERSLLLKDRAQNAIALDVVANTAEASDILAPVKAACKTIKSIIDVKQTIDDTQGEWSDLVRRLEEYMRAIEGQIDSLEKYPPEDRVVDGAFSQSLVRYVELLEDIHRAIVNDAHKRRHTIRSVFTAIRKVKKIDNEMILKFNREIKGRHRQFTEVLDLFIRHRVHVIERNTKITKSHVDASFLFQLPMVTFVPSSVHSTCLPGTRQAVLETISHWAENSTSNNPIFWLCDIAGAGKSTVAMTAMELWEKKGILGGRFFFSMSSKDASTTEKLCSTIARDLVHYIPELAPHVSQAVTRNPSIMRGSLDEQFQTLVTGPLRHRHRHRQGRIILVIDAVDECKSSSQRKKLLEALSTAVRGCKNLRIFVTSRPDPVIETVLGSLSIKSKLEDRLHSLRHRDNIDDIAIYVGQTLDGVLSKDKIQRLVEKANGLFIWASTACRMLTDEATLNSPDSLYDRLISLDQRGAIDKVYDLIFERIDEESHPVLCQMFALLLVAFEPLTIDDMEDLIKHLRVPGAVRGLINNFGSVLSTEPSTNFIQFRHPTLVEYLQRCSNSPAGGSHKRIYLDVINAHAQAASWCLQHLKSRTDGLKFNICQVESSFYLNNQIPDLDEKISKFIPRRLRYASSHWLFHVSEMYDKKPCPLENDVRYIVQSPQVLYWMEVLSFTRSVPRAIDGLRVLSDNMAKT